MVILDGVRQSGNGWFYLAFLIAFLYPPFYFLKETRLKACVANLYAHVNDIVIVML